MIGTFIIVLCASAASAALTGSIATAVYKRERQRRIVWEHCLTALHDSFRRQRDVAVDHVLANSNLSLASDVIHTEAVQRAQRPLDFSQDAIDMARAHIKAL